MADAAIPLRSSPDHIIDINRVEGLSYIRERKLGGQPLEIGAMTGQRDLGILRRGSARSWPIMHEALLQVGHRQTRNRGTIGGSLCHLDPAAELRLAAEPLRRDR
jgi:carbon-monoxide dehydrogenase medium subunit